MTLDEAVDKYYAEHRGLSASMDSDYLKLIISSILPTLNKWNYGKPSANDLIDSDYLVYAMHSDFDIKEYVVVNTPVFEDMCKDDSHWEIYAWQYITPVNLPKKELDTNVYEIESHEIE